MVSIDGTLNDKTVYIFRENKELIISFNGKVEKAKWDYLGNQSILIDKGSESFLFKHGFYDTEVLALRMDSSEKYAVFVNENLYDEALNSIETVNDFLNGKYINSKTRYLKDIEDDYEEEYEEKLYRLDDYEDEYEDVGDIEIKPTPEEIAEWEMFTSASFWVKVLGACIIIWTIAYFSI